MVEMVETLEPVQRYRLKIWKSRTLSPTFSNLHFKWVILSNLLTTWKQEMLAHLKITSEMHVAQRIVVLCCPLLIPDCCLVSAIFLAFLDYLDWTKGFSTFRQKWNVGKNEPKNFILNTTLHPISPLKIFGIGAKPLQICQILWEFGSNSIYFSIDEKILWC